MGMQPATHKRLFECYGCCYEVSGYSKKDLESEGWFFQSLNVTRDFAICSECVDRFTPAWEAKNVPSAR